MTFGETDGSAHGQTDQDSGTATSPDSEDGTNGSVAGGISVRKDRQVRRAAGPSILERFARAEGFTNDGKDCYRRLDGSWISRTDGDRFWERRTGSGEFVRSYWPKDHCLEREPLVLDADIWGLIDKFPEDYALILTDQSGGPIEVPGRQLRAMCEGGNLTLYPATYRLVVNQDIEH